MAATYSLDLRTKILDDYQNQEGSHSPDLSPIELCWSKLKEILRSIGARTADALDLAVSFAIPLSRTLRERDDN